MPNNSKMILGIAVVVIVIGAIWWFIGMSGGTPSPAMTTTQGTGTSGAGMPAAQDTSDQTLTQSVANIDAQMGSLSADAASIDQGLNDQSVPQEQL